MDGQHGIGGRKRHGCTGGITKGKEVIRLGKQICKGQGDEKEPMRELKTNSQNGKRISKERLSWKPRKNLRRKQSRIK